MHARGREQVTTVGQASHAWPYRDDYNDVENPPAIPLQRPPSPYSCLGGHGSRGNRRCWAHLTVKLLREILRGWGVTLRAALLMVITLMGLSAVAVCLGGLAAAVVAGFTVATNALTRSRRHR
jgi:hypothetical protein